MPISLYPQSEAFFKMSLPASLLLYPTSGAGGGGAPWPLLSLVLLVDDGATLEALVADGLSLRVPLGVGGGQQRVEGIGDIEGFFRNGKPPGRRPDQAEHRSDGKQMFSPGWGTWRAC